MHLIGLLNAFLATIFALVPVVALITAHFIYKKKITVHASAGVALAIAGVALLIWRNPILAFFPEGRFIFQTAILQKPDLLFHVLIQIY